MAERSDTVSAPSEERFGEFDDLWRERIQLGLAALERERKRAIGRARLIVGAAIALAILLVALLSRDNVIVWWAAFGLCILSLIAADLSLKPVRKKAKAALLHPVLEGLGYRYQEKHFDPAGYEDARRFSLLPGSDRRSFEDWIAGEHEGARFHLYEAKLEQKRRSKKRTYYVTVFQGVIGRIDHDSSALGETVFTRDKGWFDGLSAPRGMDQARLIDSTFEDVFTVYTTDQVEARYLLPPNMMEHLVALERDFQGKKIRGAFYDGGLMFLIETKNLFEPGSIFKPMDDPSRFQNLIGEIRSVRRLIHKLRQVRP